MFRSLTPWTRRLPRFTEMERELPSLFERMFGMEEWPLWGEGFAPRTNVSETPEALEVTVELPGMKPEEVHVELRNHELWVTGEKKEEKEEKGKTFLRVERRYGEFKRVIPLPENVNAEKVAAEFREGVLKIAIPKTAETKPKEVQVVAA
ncbi:MAG: Hsp20/alpha crystallin family protein [Pirellulales bacterium]